MPTSPFDAQGRLRSNLRARSKSIENFATPFDSELRTGRVSSSVFALVSTIIGGGVLSLPYAFAKAGAVLGPLFLVASAAASDFSIYILVSSARRTGARNYEAVASAAFGRRARTATVLLLFVLTFMCCVAYIVLARDLTSPLVARWAGLPPTAALDSVVCLVWVGLVLPACMRRSMSGLRYNSILSVTSISFLGVAIAVRAAQHLHRDGFGLLVPPSIGPSSSSA